MTGILEVLDEHSDRLDLMCVKARREIKRAVKEREETIIEVPDLTTVVIFTMALEQEGFNIGRESRGSSRPRRWRACGNEPSG